jgi:hypothetical protein
MKDNFKILITNQKEFEIAKKLLINLNSNLHEPTNPTWYSMKENITFNKSYLIIVNKINLEGVDPDKYHISHCRNNCKLCEWACQSKNLETVDVSFIRRQKLERICSTL